ncbi:hypothetical protein IPJ72_02410 [Candidatus Peregrinibacteria bacterium]|nr:MAG: hypothetical protein IPJ72_02410 [Candidatus Peregrinibacteria bacterium]
MVTTISGYLRIFEWGWPLVFQEIYFESPGTPQPEPVWINLFLDLAFWLAVSYGIISVALKLTKNVQNKHKF